MAISFGLPLVLLTLTIIAYLFKFKPKNYHLILYMICALIGIFTWLSFAVHLPIWLATNDVCNDIPSYLNSNITSNSPQQEALQTLISCINNNVVTLPFNDVTSQIQQITNSLANEAAPYNISVNTSLPYISPSQVDLQKLINFLTPQLNNISNFLANSSFNDSTTQKIRNDVQDSHTLLLMLNELLTLFNCQQIRSLFSSIETTICDSFEHGLQLVYYSDIVIGILIFPGTYIGLVVFQNYVHKSVPELYSLDVKTTTLPTNTITIGPENPSGGQGMVPIAQPFIYSERQAPANTDGSGVFVPSQQQYLDQQPSY